ncbi:TetR/AcrR family transcriptional regulator [Cytobacillus depressus]|uniref:TetR/AcrR family transcriptional regulator n=1 Tax=Cytobacillus depressus TaxID=1602942 RepID=A0A6L3UYZ5_9BACI|nr:TetR/AcrR family transcriptional regulator [Cytobacillus depressus]KAB2328628.1 TetR/AcrR family transcriptional regulator [Cytobacillus depressus]
MPPIVSDEYKQKRKQQILDSALICFARKGFQAATIDEIVKHSGISKGAIYNYFKSKDEIYLALMTEQTETNNARILNEIGEFQTASEKLNYVFELYKGMDPYEKDRKKIIVVHYEFTLHSSRDEEINKILKVRGSKFFLKLIMDIIKEGQSSGEFRADIDLLVVANMFWTVIDGAMIHTIVNDEFPYEKVIENYQRMIMSFLEK